MAIVVVREFGVTAAPATVIDYLKDFGHTEQWDPGTRRTTRNGSGPITVGTSWHNESKILGVTSRLTYTLCELTAERLVFIGRNEGATSTDTITVRPAEGGSLVTYHLDLEMHGLAKLATPVMKIEFEKLGDETVTRLTDVLGKLGAQAL
jgi:carbon monoxide dehydrogenase subunit G